MIDNTKSEAPSLQNYAGRIKLRFKLRLGFRTIIYQKRLRPDKVPCRAPNRKLHISISVISLILWNPPECIFVTKKK